MLVVTVLGFLQEGETACRAGVRGYGTLDAARFTAQTVHPKSRLGIRTELKGVCFSLFGVNQAVCVFSVSGPEFL